MATHQFSTKRIDSVISLIDRMWHDTVVNCKSDALIDLYAVDADVAKMFMTPKGMHIYGAILRSELDSRNHDCLSKEVHEALAEQEARVTEFLGNLLFFTLTKDHPLILFPDHAEDLERIAIATWKNATKEFISWENTIDAIKTASAETIKTAKTKLGTADKIEEPESSERKITGIIAKILNNLRGNGPVGELLRLDALGTQSSYLHVDQFKFRDKNNNEIYLLPPLDADGKYIPQASRLSNRIYRELISLPQSYHPSRKFWLMRDAQALTHMAWCNEQLAKDNFYLDLNGALKRVGRIKLITGSSLIPIALRSLDLEALSNNIVSPLSFLGHAAMEHFFEESTNQSKDHSPLVPTLKNLRDFINTDNPSQIIEKPNIELKKLTETWEGRQLFDPHSRMPEISQAIYQLNQAGTQLDKLESFITSLSTKTWFSFARVVASLKIQSIDPDQLVLRNIPPIVFKNFPVAQEISRKLYCTEGNSNIPKRAETVLTTKSVKQLQGEDPSHYTEFVCYALYGLMHKTLRTAQACAELAMSIAESETIKKSPYIKGDEAYYLLGHITRLQACSPKDLERANGYLKLAIQAEASLTNLISENQGSNCNLSSTRLLAETFSINAHREYLNSFGIVEPWNPDNRSSERKPEKIIELFDEGYSALSKIPNDNPPTDYCSHYIKQQLLVNLAQLALLAKFPCSRLNESSVSIYFPTQIDRPVKDREAQFGDISKQLIEQCTELDNDSTGKLPKASVLALTVAGAAGCVFLGKRPPDYSEPIFIAKIDKLRYSYLLNILRRFK